MLHVFFFFFFFFFCHPCLIIKMHATDAKMQKIKPDPIFFYDGQKFRRQCVMALTLENKINYKKSNSNLISKHFQEPAIKYMYLLIYFKVFHLDSPCMTIPGNTLL